MLVVFSPIFVLEAKLIFCHDFVALFSYYRIIRNGYQNNWKKRMIAEALLIKELKPTLNKLDKSIPLKLFN